MEKAIFNAICLIKNEKKQILVQNRSDKKYPGLALPGGHVERFESFVECVIREVKEETGLDVLELKLAGIKQFTYNENIRYVMIMFKALKYEGTIKSSDEGEVFWLDFKDLDKYKLTIHLKELIHAIENESNNEMYYPPNESKFYLK